MKKIVLYIIIVAFAFSCEEAVHGPIDSDPHAPGTISNVLVTNISGGAKIEYDIPDDNDLLYVKAKYTITNGKTFETKSSLYERSIMVKGFNDAEN